MFQRRHYEKFAREIREAIMEDEDKATIANFLVNVFKDDNERFNRERFLDACGFGVWNEN